MEIGQRPPQVQAVNHLNTEVVELQRRFDKELGGVEDPLLVGLRMADDLINHAKKLRSQLLTHARRRGQSWSVIAEATQTSSSTWRTRHHTTEGD